MTGKRQRRLRRLTNRYARKWALISDKPAEWWRAAVERHGTVEGL